MANKPKMLQQTVVVALWAGIASGFTKVAELCRAWIGGTIDGKVMFEAWAAISDEGLRNRAQKAFTQGLRQIPNPDYDAETDEKGERYLPAVYVKFNSVDRVVTAKSENEAKREVSPETLAKRTQKQAQKARDAAKESAGAMALSDPFETVLTALSMIDAAYQSAEGTDRTKLDGLVLSKLAKIRATHGMTLSEQDIAAFQKSLEEATARNAATGKGAGKAKDVTATHKPQ